MGLLDWLSGGYNTMPPQELEENGWKTRSDINRGKTAPWGYSDTPWSMGGVIPRKPNWTMNGEGPYGTASFPTEPTEYDSKDLLNQLLRYKPGTWNQRMDVERMMLDNELNNTVFRRLLSKPQSWGM